MKKLCLMAAAVVMAVATQGATINWGGLIYGDGLAALTAGTEAFLVYSDVAFSVGADSTFDGTSFTTGGATVAETVRSQKLDSVIVNSYQFGAVYDKPGEDVNGYYAVLISNATDPTAYSFLDLGQVSGNTADAKPVDLSVQDKSLTANGFTVAAAGSGGGTIPEPTSGLLLVLGGAILALRRRHA